MSDRLPRFEVEDRIGILTLNDPATLNALSPAAFARLREIFAEVRARDNVHALVITGTGRGFCAGAELASMFKTGTEQPQTETVGQRIARWTREEGTPAVMDWHDLPVPVVCAINGVTAGIGLSLALSADVVLAARSASFAIPFLTVLGIVPDGGVTWQLVRAVGPARASAMSLLGEKISAEQAESWGMIWRCVDDEALLESARSIARRLADLPPYAATELRAAFAQAWRNDFEAQYHYELGRNEELLDGPHFEEGLKAFLARRPPRFRDIG